MRELREAGFDDVHVDTVTHVQQEDEAAALWAVLSTAPPALALLARIGADAAEDVRSAFFSQMRERFGDGPIRLSNEAHVAVAQKRA